MTRMEFFRTATEEELISYLCDEHERRISELNDRGEDFSVCKTCPAADTCRIGHTGFKDWLNAEAEL